LGGGVSQVLLRTASLTPKPLFLGILFLLDDLNCLPSGHSAISFVSQLVFFLHADAFESSMRLSLLSYLSINRLYSSSAVKHLFYNLANVNEPII
jgi:hypothetical protein